MLAVAPESEARFVVDSDWESMTFLIPPHEIGAHLAARHRDDEFRVPQGVETLQVDAAKVRQLFDWGNRLVDTAAHESCPTDPGSDLLPGAALAHGSLNPQRLRLSNRAALFKKAGPPQLSIHAGVG
jgi:hypothetical protein